MKENGKEGRKGWVGGWMEGTMRGWVRTLHSSIAPLRCVGLANPPMDGSDPRGRHATGLRTRGLEETFTPPTHPPLAPLLPCCPIPPLLSSLHRPLCLLGGGARSSPPPLLPRHDELADSPTHRSICGRGRRCVRRRRIAHTRTRTLLRRRLPLPPFPSSSFPPCRAPHLSQAKGECGGERGVTHARAHVGRRQWCVGGESSH